MTKEIKGWHILSIFALAFAVIITVNVALAVNAVRTFPGLEVPNTYVASQKFDRNKTAQLALNWDVAARLENNVLRLIVREDGVPVEPVIEAAIFGRATHVGQDQEPYFFYDGDSFVAQVDGGAGNWNLRIEMRAKDGTLFKQRVPVRVAK